MLLSIQVASVLIVFIKKGRGKIPMKYLPYRLTHVLSKRAKELNRKYGVKSMWYTDGEISVITICTDGPGYWIGRGGTKLNNLEAEISSIMRSNNITICVRIKECETP